MWHALSSSIHHHDLLGGALRPGYSHISDTVSELLSPGAPNKSLLVIFQITHALLGSLFGIGVYQFVRGSAHDALIGRIGAGMIIAVATLDTPIMGLTERLGILAGFQWTFVLALKLFLL